MTEELDRDAFLRLLESLGAESDAETLAAARKIHAQVAAAGVTWDELLVPEEPAEAAPEVLAELEDRDDEAADAEAAPAAAIKDAEALKLIERLLEKSELSEETRAELRDFKKDIAAGEFDAMDRRYLKALSARLAKRK